MNCAIVGFADCAPSDSAFAAIKATSVLFRIELSPGAQVVELHDRVEDHEVATDRLAAVNRIVGEQHECPFSDGTSTTTV